MYVNSTNPSPRPGIKGLLDRITGPGATPAELLLQFVPSLVAAVAAPTYAVTLPIEWTPLQLGLIAFFGFDLVGGVLTNATSSAKRWYHRKGQGWQQHFAFVCLHIVHIFLVAKIIREGDWEFFLGTSMYLLGASVIILRSPLYLQRPVALLLYGLALLGNCYLFSPTPGLEWFVPLFFLKILVSHLLSDAPLHPGETQ